MSPLGEIPAGAITVVNMPVLFKLEAFDGVAGQLYCIGLLAVLNEAVSSVFHLHCNCCGTVLFHHISIQEDYDGIH